MSIIEIMSVGLIALVIGAVIAGTLRSSGRSGSHTARTSAIAAVSVLAVLLAGSGTARALIVPTVGLGTAAGYSVLAGETVTNTGDSTLALSAGVSPGSAVTGFPPGLFVPPGGSVLGPPAANQAKADLTAAYLDAAGRPVNVTTASGELAGLTLVGGVYSAPSKAPLAINGTLTLDGEGDPNSVFIFQTDSTLITGSASTVTMINGARECNVFWQVGSSATLGSGSTFVGNILALTSISVNNGVTIQGRALAQTGSVTLINDVFTAPTCDLAPVPATSVPGATDTTVPGGAGTTIPGGATTLPPSTNTLPETGTTTGTGGLPAVAAASLAIGLVAVLIARRRPMSRS